MLRELQKRQVLNNKLQTKFTFSHHVASAHTQSLSPDKAQRSSALEHKVRHSARGPLAKWGKGKNTGTHQNVWHYTLHTSCDCWDMSVCTKRIAQIRYVQQGRRSFYAVFMGNAHKTQCPGGNPSVGEGRADLQLD